jgi:hypothetical protein
MDIHILVSWEVIPCLVVHSIGTNVSEEHIVSIINPEDGSNVFFPNVGTHISDYIVSQPRSLQHFSIANLKI